ncbi:MAG: dihydrolipoyl dehydrogenase [Myxococcales bacterium]|nr:dihydrolipoyl dehydrogenase [Myxococcota bacterium]MDW8281780.1 dihydrolipoyl dehydrogenase [Myxococcales bacterium]
MRTLRTDVAVIGSGPGGYVAAIRAGQLGRQVVCIEKDAPGGVCLNVGCIPSKALITVSKQFEKLSQLSVMGIQVGEPRIDVAQMQRWKEEVVGKLTHGVRQLIQGAGGQLLKGTARLAGRGVLDVVGPEGTTRIEARDIIIATGSRPLEVPGFPVDNVRILDSTGALALREVPRRLAILGGGYIGLELGTMWAKLGAQVTVIELTDQLLPGTDPELVQVVQRKLKKLGVVVHLRHRAVRLEEEGATLRLHVAPREGGDEVVLECDHVLVTVGRRPNSEDLGLETAGVRVDERGFIVVDRQQRTNVPGLYAIGDVCGQPMLAHKASREAEVAAEVIAGHKAEMDAVAIPAVIFTDPEIASVGMTAAQAESAGHKVVVGKYSFAAHGRALTALETDGFVKVVADADTRQVLGLHIVGPGATDLISEGALALEMGSYLPDLALTIHPHPTLGEAVMEAAKAALGESPHIVGGGQRRAH